MTKTKLTAGVVAFLVLAGVIVWQHRQDKRMLAEVDALREQVEQIATLKEENQHLAEQLKALSDRSQTELSELLRLRGQLGQLKEAEQENNRLRAERDRLVKAQSSATAPQEAETPEVKLRRTKSYFGRDLGKALILAADANGGNVPAELSGPLFEMVERLSAGAEYGIRAKHFEPVYTGSLRDVKDASETILAREKEPVQRAGGQWFRLYVLRTVVHGTFLRRRPTVSPRANKNYGPHNSENRIV